MQDLKKKKSRVLLPSEGVKGRKAFVVVVSRKFALQFQIKFLSFCRHLFVHIIEEDAGFLLKALKCSKYFLVIMQEDLTVGPVMGHEPVPFHSFWMF